MFEGHLGAEASVAIVTEFPPDAEDEHDWTHFTTFVDLGVAGGGGHEVRHEVQHDGDGSCSMVRVLARLGAFVLQFDRVTTDAAAAGAGAGAGAAEVVPPAVVEARGTAKGGPWRWVSVPAPPEANCHHFTLHGTAHVDKVEVVA